MRLRIIGFVSLLSLSSFFVGLPPAYSQKGVVGEIEFVKATKQARTSGVWIDGQYVGYMDELKGFNRVRLLPGEHEIAVRQAGYEDFTQRVTIEPGWTLHVHPVMEKDSRFKFPDQKTSAEVSLAVRPERAAVFVDDNFAGHVDQFKGLGRMLVAPGKHTIKVALPGYKAFETEVSLLPRQKFTLKTELQAGSINDADPLIRSDRPSALRTTSLEGEPSGLSK